MSRSRKIRLGVGLLAGVVVLGFFYGRAQASEKPHLGTSGQVSVAPAISIDILSPGSGVEFAWGSPITVDMQAVSTSPITSMELWAGDLLVADEDIPSSANALVISPSSSWLPSGPGLHVLRARTASLSGGSAESPPVWVLVGSTDALGRTLGPQDVTVALAASGGGLERLSMAEVAQLAPPAPPTSRPLHQAPAASLRLLSRTWAAVCQPPARPVPRSHRL